MRMYTCGLTVYARGHIGNFRTFVALDVLRRALKYEAATSAASASTTPTSTTARSSNRRRPACRCASTPRSTSRPSSRTPRRSASSRSKRIRAPPMPRTSRRWGIRSRRSSGTATPIERRLDLLQDLDVARLRQAGAPRSRRHQERRARRLGQVRQGRRARLRAVEGDEAGRADLGSGHRPRPSRLAHRVLRDGAAAARRAADRHPRRRRRPDLPASRERDRAERRGDTASSSPASGSTSST